MARIFVPLAAKRTLALLRDQLKGRGLYAKDKIASDNRRAIRFETDSTGIQDDHEWFQKVFKALENLTPSR